MPTKTPDREARREQALKRLGTRNPSCVVCNEGDPLCLELHHIGGQKHHEDLAIVCRNCHRKLSDQQRDHPADTQGQHPTMATIGHYLLGLADLFRLLATSLVQFGTWLIELGQPPAQPHSAGV
jgi:hypothetical protein